jgi:hypothetical protein
MGNDPKIDSENDNTLKISLPGGREVKGGGTKWVMLNYFSPSPQPSLP